MTSHLNQVDLYLTQAHSGLLELSRLVICGVTLFDWCLNAESPSSPALVIIPDGV